MIKVTDLLKDAYRKKGLFNQALKAFLKEKNVSIDEYKKNPSIFTPLP